MSIIFRHYRGLVGELLGFSTTVLLVLALMGGCRVTLEYIKVVAPIPPKGAVAGGYLAPAVLWTDGR